MEASEVVDLAFRVQGREVAADHGYLLYAAIARVAPAVHGDGAIGIHPLQGRLTGGRRLALGRGSRLVVRVSAERIPELLPLVGQRLDVGGSVLTVGAPSVWALRPVAAVWSRLVVIKGFMEPGGFLDAAQRQLTTLGVEGRATLMARTTARTVEGRSATGAGDPIRRTLRIHEKEVVGFALGVEQLTAEESIRVQAAGLGGRRRFGCGVFIPAVR
ncbi:MAG: type I-MYXAN CRISPR-associated protein Cas6/Cmx6 [Dehalococcoidia bacterium]